MNCISPFNFSVIDPAIFSSIPFDAKSEVAELSSNITHQTTVTVNTCVTESYQDIETSEPSPKKKFSTLSIPYKCTSKFLKINLDTFCNTLKKYEIFIFKVVRFLGRIGIELLRKKAFHILRELMNITIMVICILLIIYEKHDEYTQSNYILSIFLNIIYMI